jgi:hypothetical protein
LSTACARTTTHERHAAPDRCASRRRRRTRLRRSPTRSRLCRHTTPDHAEARRMTLTRWRARTPRPGRPRRVVVQSESADRLAPFDVGQEPRDCRYAP